MNKKRRLEESEDRSSNKRTKMDIGLVTSEPSHELPGLQEYPQIDQEERGRVQVKSLNEAVKSACVTGSSEDLRVLVNDPGFNRRSFCRTWHGKCGFLTASQRGYVEIVQTLMELKFHKKVVIQSFQKACEYAQLDVAKLYLPQLREWKLDNVVNCGMHEAFFTCCRIGEAEKTQALLCMHTFTTLILRQGLQDAKRYAKDQVAVVIGKALDQRASEFPTFQPTQIQQNNF